MAANSAGARADPRTGRDEILGYLAVVILGVPGVLLLLGERRIEVVVEVAVQRRHVKVQPMRRL
jgi:hypothetical protein